MMTRDKDLRRVVKERSARLENDAKKQNDYQERRLTKFISSMEKEHNGNMTQIQAQQRELEKKSDDLNDRIDRFQHYVFDQDMFDAQDLVNRELTNLLEPPAPKPVAHFTVNNLYGDQGRQYKMAEVRNPKMRKQPTRTKINWESLTPMMMAAAQLLKKHGAQEEGVPSNGMLYHGFAANILQDSRGQCAAQPRGFRVQTKSKYTLISDTCALPSVEGGQGWAANRMEKQMFGSKMVRS